MLDFVHQYGLLGIKGMEQKKPKYDKMIKEYSQKIVTLKGQIEELIMERIADRFTIEHY